VVARAAQIRPERRELETVHPQGTGATHPRMSVRRARPTERARPAAVVVWNRRLLISADRYLFLTRYDLPSNAVRVSSELPSS
jgi:hypothetical protein